MSLSFELVCHETEQRVWVGQGHHDPVTHQPVMTTFYSGEPQTMEALGRFLCDTHGKPVLLVVTDYPENEAVLSYRDMRP